MSRWLRGGWWLFWHFKIHAGRSIWRIPGTSRRDVPVYGWCVGRHEAVYRYGIRRAIVVVVVLMPVEKRRGNGDSDNGDLWISEVRNNDSSGEVIAACKSTR